MRLIQLAYRKASMALSVSSITAVVVPGTAKAATTSTGDLFSTCPTGQLPFACKVVGLISSDKKDFTGIFQNNTYEKSHLTPFSPFWGSILKCSEQVQ